MWSAIGAAGGWCESRVWGTKTRDSSTGRGKRCRGIWTRVINRLKAVLATHGVRLTITGDFLEQVAATRVWDGSEIPPGARERLAHDWAQLQGIEEQLAAVKAARARLRIDPATTAGRAVQAPKGCGRSGRGAPGSWRPRFLGGARSGMGGSSAHSSGWCRRCIKAGRRSAIAGLRGRAMRNGRMMVQLAWGWLRWQSNSALAQWYQRRFATGGSRQRRIGIVALARKLLIALWRYVDQGLVPEGARLKVTVA